MFLDECFRALDPINKGNLRHGPWPGAVLLDSPNTDLAEEPSLRVVHDSPRHKKVVMDYNKFRTEYSEVVSTAFREGWGVHDMAGPADCMVVMGHYWGSERDMIGHIVGPKQKKAAQKRAKGKSPALPSKGPPARARAAEEDS